jgi:hypothetical protein
VELSLINPIANLLPDKVEICPGGNQKIGITAGAIGRQVLWSNGSTADSIEITATDSLVWVEIKVRNDCPPIRDSIQVVQKEINSNLLADDISICKGRSQTIAVNPSGLNNPKWNNGNNIYSNGWCNVPQIPFSKGKCTIESKSGL